MKHQRGREPNDHPAEVYTPMWHEQVHCWLDIFSRRAERRNEYRSS